MGPVLAQRDSNLPVRALKGPLHHQVVGIQSLGRKDMLGCCYYYCILCQQTLYTTKIFPEYHRILNSSLAL